jgi:hypothetical protein
MRRLVLIALTAAACSSSTPASQLFASAPQPASVVPGQPVPVARVVGYDPTSILLGQNQITWIALSDNFLFMVVNGRGVYRMPKYGGAADTVDADNHSGFTFTLTHGDKVYWNHLNYDGTDTATTHLMSREVNGGPSTTLLSGWLEFDQNSFPGYQIDDHYLYYFEAADHSNNPPIRLSRLPLAGGAPQILVPGGGPFSLGAYLGAFLASDGDVFVSDGHTLQVYAAGGTTAKHVADLPGDPGGSSSVNLGCADADYVYVADSQHIYRIARGGGTVEAIYTAPDPDSDIFDWNGTTPIVDASNLYFVQSTKDSWEIVSLPKAGGTAQRLSRGGALDFAGGIDALLQDDKNLFILHDYGEVLMLPKTPTGPVQ